MSVFLVLETIAGDWLIDGGSVRRVCSSGVDLLAALADADRSEMPSTGSGIVLEVESIRGGWVVRWTPDDRRPRSLVVRDDPSSADRLLEQLTEREPSLSGLTERVEALAYGGRVDESITVQFGDDQISVSRGQLRMVSHGLRVLRHIGKAVSISPKPKAKVS